MRQPHKNQGSQSFYQINRSFSGLLSTRLKRRKFLAGAGVLLGLGTARQQGWATPNSNLIWRSPSELVTVGFERSPVVMMNEAHNGATRNIRSREIGRQILPVAHAAGVRYLAMEALTQFVATETNQTRQLPKLPEDAANYMTHPEMRAFVQAALSLGWTLIPYEIDFEEYPSSDTLSLEFTNLRERVQAENLVNGLQNLPSSAKLLVWCGNSHHIKITTDEWTPMGYHFVQLSGIEHFAIDQSITVNWDDNPERLRRLGEFMPDLVKQGGTAGFLIEEAPSSLPLQESGIDAVILSTQNKLE